MKGVREGSRSSARNYYGVATLALCQPRRVGGAIKGNIPQNARHLHKLPLKISTSDEEDWPDYTAIWEKLSALPRKRAQARAAVGYLSCVGNVGSPKHTGWQNLRVGGHSALSHCCFRS